MKTNKNINNKYKNNNNNTFETTSFLKTVQTSELDINSVNNNIKQKEIEEIVSKYLDLKKKINLLLNKID
jgi:hypothetical protein